MIKIASARGADIEIIEQGRTTDDTVGGSVVIPNAMRINGVEVLLPADAVIKVHDISTSEAVTVTLTLFARSVSIRAENDPA